MLSYFCDGNSCTTSSICLPAILGPIAVLFYKFYCTIHQSSKFGSCKRLSTVLISNSLVDVWFFLIGTRNFWINDHILLWICWKQKCFQCSRSIYKLVKIDIKGFSLFINITGISFKTWCTASFVLTHSISYGDITIFSEITYIISFNCLHDNGCCKDPLFSISRILPKVASHVNLQSL